MRTKYACLILICAQCSLWLDAYAQELPSRITTRLWSEPGPAQDGEGAPRLLIVYPSAAAGPSDAPQARYGGRVDPPDAQVTLNGTALDVGYGGVFIGLKDMPEEGESATWSFKATAQGKSTTVERTVEREPGPPPPLKATPLAFWPAPVTPTGAYWLREGSQLELTLYASPDATAEFRPGPGQAWQPMQGAPDSRRGGVYRATLTIPTLAPQAPQALEPVEFRIKNGTEEKSLVSRLKLGILRKAQPVNGEILINRVTFLKHATGWERWGNWVRGTIFPVYEQFNDRLSTTLGEPGEAFVDNEEFRRVKLDLTASTSPLVRLGEPGFSGDAASFTAAWPGVARPIAFRANPLPAARATHINFDLLGAASAAHTLLEAPPSNAPVSRVELSTGEGNPVPQLTFELKQPLWGWDLEAGTSSGLRVQVRTQPRPLNATAQRPLAGLRIMLDPGHGGKDTGAIGPSGLTEADLNLVQAYYVERALKKMGATVRVTRRDDTFIELDDRVELALAWQPDLFVSLHHNSVGGGADPWFKSGPELYAHYELSHPAAESIGARLGPVWGEGALKPLPHVARVIRNYTACPAILVETAYVTNPKDEIKLRQTETIRKSGEAIAEGIADLWR